MSGIHLWQEVWVWKQLSDETKLSVLYLENLWEDTGFQAEWAHLRNLFGVKRHLVVILEVDKEVTHSEMNSFPREREGNLTKITAEKSQAFEGFTDRWALSPRIQSALHCVLCREFPADSGHKLACLILQAACIYCPSKAMNIPLRITVSDLAHAVALMLYEDLRNAAISPIKWFHPPTRWEPKCAYLAKVKAILKAEANCDTQQPEQSLIGEFERLVGYRFHDPHNAIPALLSLAEDYYEKCAAMQGTQVSNRNDSTLSMYAKVVYLHKVKGLTGWKQIAGEVMPEGEDLEDWTDRVRKALPVACRLLGIPFEEGGEFSENHL